MGHKPLRVAVPEAPPEGGLSDDFRRGNSRDIHFVVPYKTSPFFSGLSKFLDELNLRIAIRIVLQFINGDMNIPLCKFSAYLFNRNQ